MNEESKNTLVVYDENNHPVSLNVLDIIESDEFRKTFIIYNVKGSSERIYASILDENETTFSLKKITNEKEITFINKQIEDSLNQDASGENLL